MSGYLLKFKQTYSVKIGGRRYPVVKIGNQLWMAENLDYVWDSLVTNENLPGASSTHNAVYYNMDQATYGWNGRRCGLLYNQAAKYYLNDTLLQQVAPGWRVPNETDIDNLIAAINDSGNEGYVLSKGDISWAPTWTGSNIYGFNAIPTGGYSDGSGFEDDTVQWVIHCAGDRRYVDRYMGYGSGYPLGRGKTNTYPKYGIRLVSFDYGKVTIGGRDYKTIKIGNQEWLAENLDYKWTGLDIGPSGTPSTQAAWYYNNDEATYGINGTYKCGLLYNWFAAKYLDDNRTTLLPDGWHVPSKTEWETLITSVGTNPGTKLKADDNSVISGFPSSWGGTNDLGFGMLPCGTRYNGFQSLNSRAFPWTSTVYDGDSSLAYSPALRPDDSNFPIEGDYKTAGNCIRLVKSLT